MPSVLDGGCETIARMIHPGFLTLRGLICKVQDEIMQTPDRLLTSAIYEWFPPPGNSLRNTNQNNNLDKRLIYKTIYL